MENMTYQVKDYYNVKDVMAITGAKESKCYNIIRELNDKFFKEYPESIPIRGLVPRWYFEKIMMNKGE